MLCLGSSQTRVARAAYPRLLPPAFPQSPPAPRSQEEDESGDSLAGIVSAAKGAALRVRDLLVTSTGVPGLRVSDLAELCPELAAGAVEAEVECLRRAHEASGRLAAVFAAVGGGGDVQFPPPPAGLAAQFRAFARRVETAEETAALRACTTIFALRRQGVGHAQDDALLSKLAAVPQPAEIQDVPLAVLAAARDALDDAERLSCGALRILVRRAAGSPATSRPARVASRLPPRPATAGRAAHSRSPVLALPPLRLRRSSWAPARDRASSSSSGTTGTTFLRSSSSSRTGTGTMRGCRR